MVIYLDPVMRGHFTRHPQGLSPYPDVYNFGLIRQNVGLGDVVDWCGKRAILQSLNAMETSHCKKYHNIHQVIRHA